MTTADWFSRSLGVVIADRMKAAGIAQRGMAEKSGIPLVTLSRRLTGKSTFTIAELVTIAYVLGDEVTDLVDRAEHNLVASTGHDTEREQGA